MATRRTAIQSTPGALAVLYSGVGRSQESDFQPQIAQIPELAGKLGIVTASLSSHISATPTKDKFTLLELPAVLKEELDLDVVDFNTMNFPSFEPAYLEKLRGAVEKSTCVATNLKMNQRVNMDSADPSERAEAMRVYKESIVAAQILGLKWVRPLPRSDSPDPDRHVSSFTELIDFAGERGITLLIENFGWMMDDPNSVVHLADQIGRERVAIGPDTGNWINNEVRYKGLQKTFPGAVTCDFKAKTMGPNGEHAAYDLKKCFEIGWSSGFRGPWNFEHGHRDRQRAFREIGLLRDWMRFWFKEQEENQ